MNRQELLEALEFVRTIDEDIPIQTLSVFLYVSVNGPQCKQTDLTEWLGMAQSTVSRNVSYLSKRNRLGKAGLGLVESMENPDDRRYKIVRLTPKGQKLAKLLDNLENVDGKLRLSDKKQVLGWKE